ncbi:hypothetical protein NM208_g2281 [Fusarium decemcellulare]|uniref:Uncharacterized protein n=1 Tax=Fusarium decemcellulare TaxID=57161 RepID=A0ACC1ST89_9HYPO|nr:hypothetical protein NM208_g2281 [Fusarium decemcellulare]
MPELKPYIDDFYLWHYVPSLVASTIFASMFAVATAIVIWRMIRTRTRFSIVFVLGGFAEVIGFAARAYATYNTDQLVPYSIQSVLILIAPALFAASIYMAFSRLMRTVQAEHYSLISPRWFTRIFVLGDGLSLAVQSGGASLATVRDLNPNVPKFVVLGGLLIQIVIFGFFIINTTIFHRRMKKQPTNLSMHPSSQWQRLLIMFYITGIFILIRSIFRVVEYMMGMDSYLFENEWPLYVFDAELMLLTMVIYGVVILRVITRVFVGKGKLGGLGWDDYITIFCILVMLVTCIFVTIGSHYGLGRRMEDIDPKLIPEALKWNSIISAVLIWTFSLPKFAIIAILKRILDYGLKTTILFWGLALSSQACILATSIWWFKQCNPVAFGWDKTIEGGTCASVKVMSDLGYFTSAYSAFLDVFFALYPVPFIMRLNMPFKSRVAISIALGLSILASVVSIYKLTIFGSVFEVLAEDPTYPVPFLDILGLSEGCILVVCASLPTLGPLFRLARGKLSTINSSHGPSQRVASNQGNHSESSGRWDKLRGHRLDDVENRSTGMGSSVDDIPLVSGPKQPIYGPREVHKGNFGVVPNNQRAH